MSQSLAQQLAEMQEATARALVDEIGSEAVDQEQEAQAQRRVVESAIANLSEEELEALQWDWGFWGRPEQWLPPQPWRTWLVLAGRGYGKSRTASEALRACVATGQIEHIGIVGKTPADVRDVMIEGPAGILRCSPPHQRPLWEPSKRRLTWPNGARATVFSGENPDQLRGPQHQLLLFDELAAFQYLQDTWDNASMGLRLPWKDGTQARAIITTTPKPSATLKAIIASPTTKVTLGSTFDNADNLDGQFLADMRARYEGTRLGRQELYAELLDEIAGAYWTRAVIEKHRVMSKPAPAEVQRIVVAIDPAATSGEESAETGIVVVARGYGQRTAHAWVLADRSCRLPPAGWAQRAIDAAEEFGADCIVAEDNNGGEMVEHTIRMLNPKCKVKRVHATRGKKVRAEPISALYEQGRVHHVGGFALLEDQMVSYTGATGEQSPDRLDALVWAISELAVTGRQPFTLTGSSR